MRTQLYISPNRKGTVSVTNGSITVTGTNTAFTDADDGSTIIFRTSRGDIERVILNANPNTQTLTLNAAMPLTESGIFYYLEYVEVDLYEDIPFTLTFNIADIRNPDKRNGSYSKTVRLPGTDTNNALLGNIFEIDIDGSYNPNIKALAYIDIDSIEQFRGVLQLLQINRTRDFIEYEVSIFGNIGGFFNSVGNKQLRDLDLSAYNHKVTFTNIEESWFEQIQKNGSNYDNFTGSVTTRFPNGQPSGEGYTYPLIFDGYSLPTGGGSFKFELPTIRGAVYAKQIIDSMFSSVGYTYTSDLLNSAMFKKLIVPMQRRAKHKVLAQLSIDVQRDFQGVIFSPVLLGGGKIFLYRYNLASNTFTEITSVEVPLSNNITEVVTYTISEEVELEYGDWLYVEANCIGLTNAGGNPSPMILVAQLFLTNATFTITYQQTGDVVSNVDGSMQVFGTSTTITSPTAAGTNQIVEFETIVSDPNNTWDVAGNYHEATEINLQANLHANIKQVDFFMSIVKMFNLYIDVDKDNYQNLIIKPYNDFISDDVLDWTMKLDNSRQIEIYPMGELDFRQFLWTYKPDGDVANQTYTSRWQEAYGQYLQNIENDFVTNQQKIELIFSPTHGIGNGPVYIAQHYKGDPNKPEPFEQNIRILSHNGKYDLSAFATTIGLWGSFNNSSPLASLPYYPQSLHLDDAQAPTMDLLFGIPKQVYWKFDNPAIYTTNNLYNQYWKKYISEITDKDSKIVKMWLYLTVNDINKLDFTKKYFINNSYYRLNKIENYNPITEQVTKCEFLKISEGAAFNPGDTDNPIDNLVNYNLVNGGIDEVRNIAADSFYNVVVGGKDEVRNLAATSPFHIIRG